MSAQLSHMHIKSLHRPKLKEYKDNTYSILRKSPKIIQGEELTYEQQQ